MASSHSVRDYFCIALFNEDNKGGREAGGEEDSSGINFSGS